jgi:hypothetical protein
MREKISLKIMLILFIITVFNSAFSQETKVNSKYVIINNIDEFIVESDGIMIIENFHIFNFPEEESSKMTFIDVTEIQGVVKFSIESSSSTHAGQRRCRLVIKTESWKYTLRNAFIAMKIEYVLVNDEFVALNDYFNSLK